MILYEFQYDEIMLIGTVDFKKEIIQLGLF